MSKHAAQIIAWAKTLLVRTAGRVRGWLAQLEPKRLLRSSTRTVYVVTSSVVFILITALVLPRSRQPDTLPQPDEPVSLEREITRETATPGSVTEQENTLESVAVSTSYARRPESEENAPTPIQPAPIQPVAQSLHERYEPPLQTLLVVNPGDPLPPGTVDVLFVHSHPDDESISLGALMALSRRAGLRTGALIFTDGEGGIYQSFFSGPVSDDPRDLAAIRIREAEQALGILGSDYYIRLGYKNHPYGGVLDEKQLDEVLTVWGGMENVAAQIVEVIQSLQPTVVVSPSGPSPAREHFEHVATGIAVMEALEIIRANDRGEGAANVQPIDLHQPSGHLTSIDSRRLDLFDEEENIIAFARSPVIEVQRQALLAHETQADATVFGIAMIEKYKNEYYFVHHWDLDTSPESFFSLKQ